MKIFVGQLNMKQLTIKSNAGLYEVAEDGFECFTTNRVIIRDTVYKKKIPRFLRRVAKYLDKDQYVFSGEFFIKCNRTLERCMWRQGTVVSITLMHDGTEVFKDQEFILDDITDTCMKFINIHTIKLNSKP